MHHTCPQAGQFQHFVVADLGDASCFRQDSRVGGIDAVDVGVDLALVGAQHGGQGHGRRVAAAASERGDVEILVDSLKPGGDDDVAVVQRLSACDRFEIERIRALVWLLSVLMPIWAPVRLTALYPSASTAMAISATLTCSPVESSMSISRAGGRSLTWLARSISEIRVLAHRADDHHHLVAFLLCANRLAGGSQNHLGVGDTGTAELLHDQ